jgi:hypothetical protein
MNASDLELLKSRLDKPVKILCRDGEVLIAKVLFVSESEGDLSYHLISTNRESQYEKLDRQPAYLIPFEEIHSVELVQSS